MGSHSIQPPIHDQGIDAHILHLSLGINLRPSVLRLDSFPLGVQQNIFSSRLTSIEIFAGATLGTTATEIRSLANWNNLLRLTPNLVSLVLWHPGGDIFERFSESSHPEMVSLPKLTHLSLNNPYLELSSMLARSPLGSLKTLKIESNFQSANASGYIEQLASVAPHLTSLSVSNKSWAPRHAKIWTKTFDKLQSLQELTLFEMSEDMALGILDLPNLPQTLSHVRLERIHLDRGVITWPPANWSSAPPKLTISGCNKWVDIQSEDGAALRICHGSIDKTKCKDLPGEAVLYDWETSLYTIREDLALVRGASSASCFRDEDSSDELGESEDEGSSHDSGSEASFASGDLYIIEQGRELYPKSTYHVPSDSWVSTSESEVVSENDHNEEEEDDEDA
ncbi:hypothetical protein RhiJN_10113 [Ceratobasidium sp. AG-Ba]|nr:hypothetical protein RhiJN_10113 [Ceratobasidium sp. AG-Ba]